MVPGNNEYKMRTGLGGWPWCFSALACFPKGECCLPNILSSPFSWYCVTSGALVLWHYRRYWVVILKAVVSNITETTEPLRSGEMFPITGSGISSAFLTSSCRTLVGILIEWLFAWKNRTRYCWGDWSPVTLGLGYYSLSMSDLLLFVVADSSQEHEWKL